MIIYQEICYSTFVCVAQTKAQIHTSLVPVYVLFLENAFWGQENEVKQKPNNWNIQVYPNLL